MPAELLALGAAFFYASGGIAIKFGTRTGSILAGLPASLVSGVFVLGAISIFAVDSWAVPAQGVLFFGLAGIAGPGVGRLFLMRGVRDVGTSVAVPVYSSSYPLIASLTGVVLFGELIGFSRLMALLLIISGIWACGRGGSANVEAPARRPLSTSWWRSSIPLLWPLGAGAAFAIADVLRKLGLTAHGDPIVGALIGLVAALISWLAIALIAPKLRGQIRMSRSTGWFFFSGLLTGLAQLCLLFALLVGEISVVTPIAASQPVIVIILGALLLRGVETLRPGNIFGAIIVFLGVAYLSVT